MKAQHSWPGDRVTVETMLRELERNRELQNDLQDCVADYQVNNTSRCILSIRLENLAEGYDCMT